MKIQTLAIFTSLLASQALSCVTSGSACGVGQLGNKACSCADVNKLVSWTEDLV
jgi:hypothetical protein